MNPYESALVEEALTPVPQRLVVIGVDEAGRGALAGPVVVAATWWEVGVDAPFPEDRRRGVVIRDSKQMTHKQRTRSYDTLLARGRHAVVFKDHEEIDRVNILRATLAAMHECVIACLAQIPTDAHVAVLIDGNQMIADVEDPRVVLKTCVTSGDALCYSIAAASILAKHARDTFMSEYPDELYGFQKHKGYGTRTHLAAIAEHGACPIHRMSFRPFRATGTDAEPEPAFLHD